MTHEEHVKRHKELHAALDELLADWIKHNVSSSQFKSPVKLTIEELAKWSCNQVRDPTEPHVQ